MSEKVPCTACQTLIMSSTAEKNSGLCMPCKNGNRENIEQAKTYYQQQRELDKTCPFRALWRDIVVRVHDPKQGFHTLSQAEQYYYAANCLYGDVYNGGFIQYFDNLSDKDYDVAERGLEQIGALHSLALLQQAKQAVFGDHSVPTDKGQRLAATDNPEAEALLNKLDDEFYKDLDNLDTKLENYALQTGLVNTI